MLDTLYTFAKFHYECGNYSGAAEYLYFVRVLVSQTFIISCHRLIFDHIFKMTFQSTLRLSKIQQMINGKNLYSC